MKRKMKLYENIRKQLNDSGHVRIFNCIAQIVAYDELRYEQTICFFITYHCLFNYLTIHPFSQFIYLNITK